MNGYSGFQICPTFISDREILFDPLRKNSMLGNQESEGPTPSRRCSTQKMGECRDDPMTSCPSRTVLCTEPSMSGIQNKRESDHVRGIGGTRRSFAFKM